MRPLLAFGRSALLISPGTGCRFGHSGNERAETYLSVPADMPFSTTEKRLATPAPV